MKYGSPPGITPGRASLIGTPAGATPQKGVYEAVPLVVRIQKLDPKQPRA
jgi:hypothetical protein